jgi:diguanylate cyclase (GGDEF)-like protein/PAS domain S-box-containing protein
VLTSHSGFFPAHADLPGGVVASLLVDLAPVVVSHVDTDERITEVGGQLLERLGYEPADWVGKSVTDMVDDATVLRLVRAGLAGRAGADTTSLNGRACLVAVQPLHTPAGEVTGAVTLLTFADQGEVYRELTAQERLNAAFAATIELSRNFVALADLDGTVTYVNRVGREMVGRLSDEEALGRPTVEYYIEGGHDFGALLSLLLERGYWQGEGELLHARTGEAIPVAVDSYLVRSSSGLPLAVAAVQRDLREQRRAERDVAVRLQHQRALAELGRLATTLPLTELLDEVVAVIASKYPDTTAGVLRMMPDGRHSQLVAASLDTFEPLTFPVDETSLPGRAMLHDTVVSACDLTVDFPGEDLILERGRRSAISCPIRVGDRPWGAVGCAGPEPRTWTEDDIVFTESVAATLAAAVRREELETRLQHQALHDPLTGLPNRALVIDRISQGVARSTRRGSMLAVMLLDVDDFKSVNDALGHTCGDELLSDLASRLRDVVREGDTVARLGGDEFVVVCEDVGSEDEAALLAEALLGACSRPIEVSGRRFSLSGSVGVALSLAGEIDATSVLSQADMAMYRAKRDSPGSYRTFDEAMRGDALGRMNLASELRAAVRAEAIAVAYQPIVDLATGAVTSMEALARWTDHSGEQIPPELFVTVAEETGIIGELGQLVLRAAARDAAAWQDVGEIGVRVNASAHELRNDGYVDQVLSALDEAGLPASLLGVEITESVFVDEDKTTQDNLSRLREAGVCLLIDDFGTGYSSLSYLHRFPVVDVLKVDRSFLTGTSRGEAVVQAVVGLGRAFGLQVCAEGVETAEQHARVAELGCDYAQGYLFGRPLPVRQARELLGRWRSVVPPARPAGQQSAAQSAARSPAG